MIKEKTKPATTILNAVISEANLLLIANRNISTSFIKPEANCP